MTYRAMQSYRIRRSRRAVETEGLRMSIFAAAKWGVFVKGRNRNYWIAGAFLWGLTSAAFAEVATTAPAKPAGHTSSAPSAHRSTVRSTERTQPHTHTARTEHAVSAKPATTPIANATTKQPEHSYSAALSQYQFAYGNANVPFAPQPENGESRYAGTTVESQILKRNSTPYGAPAAPAAPASSVSSTASDDNWRFMANPLINATHIHEVGAAVSVRHDF
jgi:hypothetical protein